VQPPSPQKLAIKAKLVLSPEFCATKKRQPLADVFYAGESICKQLYPALSVVFSDLKRLEELPAAGSSDGEVTLVPRFVDISATSKGIHFHVERELVILVEWTIRDSAGNTIWLQTVEGISTHKFAAWYTEKPVEEWVDAAVANLAKESAARISASPELRKLSP
jgi:hypothetical protein